jgi:hypothetical protein
MEASEMTDVIHFLFEEDARYTSGEEADAVDKLRSMIYGNMYGTTYRYGSSKSSSSDRRYISKNETPNYGDLPIPMETKPYVPPTDFNPESSMPFGGVLDAPLG